MKTKTKLLISLLVLIISLILVFLFRIKPEFSPWNSFHVVIINKNVAESDVLKAFSDCGITDVISFSSKRLLTTSKLSPVLPTEYSDYENSISKMFFDKSGNFKLYYIPKNISKSKLNNFPYKYQIDINYPFYYVNIIFVLVIALALLFILNKKIRYTFLLLPVLLFIYSSPIFSSAIICCFSFIEIYLFSLFKDRKEDFLTIIKNPIFLINAFSSILFSLIENKVSFILLCLCILIFLSINYLSELVAKKIISKKESKNIFQYVNILPAYSIEWKTTKTKYIFISNCILIFLLGMFFCLFPKISKKPIANNYLSIPAPLEYTSGGFSVKNYGHFQKKAKSEFPNMATFITQKWNSAIFPYIPLDQNKGFTENIKENSLITVTEYVEENNKIVEKVNTLITFDNNFISSAIKSIKSEDKPVIESIFLTQKSFCMIDFLYQNYMNQSKNIFIMTISLFFCIMQILVTYLKLDFFMLKRK